MMKLIFKNILLLSLFLGAGTIAIQAKTVLPEGNSEFTKTIKKDFKMSGDGEVTLVNKYGDISLNTWNRNEVDIKITLTVNAKNESTANDIFDRIEIDFSNASDYVKAETIIESTKSGWWSNGDKGDFRIDYVVSMPDAASLVLNNKYGNADIAAIGGDANVIVKYGDFNLESVGENTKVSLGYGNGTIGRIKGVGLDVKYSKLKLKEAGQVNIDSKYSKIYVEKAGKMRSTSKYDIYDLGELAELNNEGKYDRFEIEKIDRITAYSKYTDFEVGELYKDGSFKLKYGGVEVDNLKKGFDMFNMESEYTDCKIYMGDGANFELDAVAEHASIYYPSDMNVSYEKDKNSTHEVKGSRGSNGGKIKARMQYGSLKIK